MLVTITYSLLIFLWGAFADLSNDAIRKRYIIVVSIILILISGMRNMYVGPDDTFNYYRKFIDAGDMTYGEVLDIKKDPLFSLFIKIVRIFIGDHFQVFLAICSSFLIIPLGLFIYKESKYPLISYLLFISLGFYGFSMVCVRQSMAIGVLLLSYNAIKKHQLTKFLICIFVASSFHLSALVFLLIYPLSYLKYNLKIFFLYIVAIVVAVTMGQVLVYSFDLSLIDERFGSYQAGEARALSASGFVQLVLFALFFAFYYKKMRNQIPEDVNLHSHFLSLAMIFQSLVFIIAEFFRVSWYFKVYVLILIPTIIVYSGRQQFWKMCFGVLLLLYFFINLGNSDYAFYWQHYVPNF